LGSFVRVRRAGVDIGVGVGGVGDIDEVWENLVVARGWFGVCLII
jgi:hypothetical protein